MGKGISKPSRKALIGALVVLLTALAAALREWIS